MCMNKKGFTLIELLAIIVILAIIAVITVPIVLGIVDEAREKAATNSVIGYGKAVEFSYSKIGVAPGPELQSCEATDGTCVTIGDKHLSVDFSGAQVVCSTVSVDASGKLSMTGCEVDGQNTPTYVYDNGRACLTSQATSGSCPQ